MKFLVKFDLEFEISDGKNLVKFWGRTFPPARKAQKMSGQISGQISEKISEKFSEISFQISRLFSENFVQQKGGANKWAFTGSQASFGLGQLSLSAPFNSCLFRSPPKGPNSTCIGNKRNTFSRVLFRFGRENSLSSVANSVSSAKTR